MVKKLQALKAKKGFTLVELIVVIAIIGVLAAILVPTMMNVVTKARVSSAEQTAKSISDSVTNWIADLESNSGTVSEGSIQFTVPDAGASALAASNFTFTGTYKRSGSEDNAQALLVDEFKTNYPFKGGEKAIIYIGADRHVKGVAYSDDDTDPSVVTADAFTANKFEWDSASKEGIKGGKIIGTNPKLLYGV